MASSPPPARRFKPEPVESSVRSSKRSHQVTDTANESTQLTSTPHDSSSSAVSNDMAPPAKPRRFLPQPVEESTRTSRKKKPIELDPTNLEDGVPASSEDSTLPGVPNTKPSTSGTRQFAPAPVETTRSSRRKFAPEPVETSARSSKDKTEDKPRRRFVPQPVETTARSSKDKDQSDTSAKPRRRFAPEPVETTVTRRRKAPQSEDPYEYAAEDGPAPSASQETDPPSRASSGGRKFSPELLETAKGTYRHRVVKPPVREKSASPPPEEDDEVKPIEESRFSAASLTKRQHEQTRKGSLMVPALSTIDSDSGDDSEAPSLTNSRSSAESEQRQNTRRAAGDSYTDYVLRLAQQNSTEKELQDQAMAAYINERTHEPVAHFAFDDEDEGSLRVGKMSAGRGVDIRTFRRSSQDDLDWEMQNMRKHHAQLEAAKRELKHDTAGQSRFSAAALATRHHREQKEQQAKKPRADEQSELAKMRAAASPPMLGNDLVFPYTISPKMTRCDTDHPPRPRTDDSDEEEEEEGDEDLWSTTVHVQKEATVGSVGRYVST